MTVSPSVSPAGSGASAVAAARAAPIVPGNYSVVPQVTLNKRPQSAKTELLRTSASFPAAPSSSPDGARAGSNSPKAMTPPLERRHNRPPRPWSGRSDTSEHRPWSDAAREQLTTVGQPQLTTKQQQAARRPPPSPPPPPQRPLRPPPRMRPPPRLQPASTATISLRRRRRRSSQCRPQAPR